MCDKFKELTGVTLTPKQIDNTTVIKFYTYAGALSSLYSEAQKTANDFFPASASLDALIKHLATRVLPLQIQPQKSHGQIVFTGTVGTPIPLYSQVKRVSDGSIFQTIQEGSIGSSGVINLFCESLSDGTIQNLDSTGDPFTLNTSITGIQSACVNSTFFLDGRDLETDSEIKARIVAHDRDDNSGGNATAYETWANEASNEVVSAKTIRLPRGPDTVDTYITAGTTDIQAAVDAGQPVLRLPSSTLISTVQAYIISLNPVTDDHLTKAPVELALGVTFKYNLYAESAASRSYADGIITKIIKVYLYQARPLDRLTPSSIERLVDQSIGDLLKERNCNNLGGANTYYDVPAINILIPGTITLSTL
jgi:uncharacterized phage protein gp47/JayE